MELYTFDVIRHSPRGAAGEDAFCHDFSRPEQHMLAVFDGCGGLGAWVYQHYAGQTGAFVAAQTVAEAALNWARNAPEELREAAESFRDAMTAALAERMAETDETPGVVGTMVRAFPCTCSLALVRKAEENALDVLALQCGDSRVYALTPGRGLWQLTRDDLRGQPDPMKNLRAGAALSQMLNAELPFRVTARRFRLTQPCAVLCATDGFFGAVRSPMDFELLLLESLCADRSLAGNGLREKVAEGASDDATAVLALYGFADRESLRACLQPRLEHVQTLTRRMDDGETPEQVWESYKAESLAGDDEGERYVTVDR